MKITVGGDGSNTTQALQTWLWQNNKVSIAHLFLLGEPEHPQSLWLTDWESPLLWSVCGTFKPAVISRGDITSAIGFDVQTLEIDWSPLRTPGTRSVWTASPYQLARAGFYDNWPVRVWKCYMPTPGDANTFGCAEAFGGLIASAAAHRAGIKITVNSGLAVVNQQVPRNVIELNNSMAAYTGARPPNGFSVLPQFNVITGSSPNVIVGQQVSPNVNGILSDNLVRGGFLVFNTIYANSGATPPVAASTVGGLWGAIQQNTRVPVGGSTYNQFELYAPLPWPPAPGVDTFYVSAGAPVNQQDGEFYGFPYVPAPESSF